MRFKNFHLLSQEKKYDKKDMLKYVDIIETALDSLGSINTDLEYNIRNSNNAKIYFKVFTPTNKRQLVINELSKIFDVNPDIELKTPSTSKIGKSILFKLKDSDFYVELKTSPVSKKGFAKVDPHELLTASVVLDDNSSKIETIDDLDILIPKLKKIAKKVDGYKQEQIDSFDKDYDNTVKAISAGHVILKWIGKVPDKAWITGDTWGKEISKFKRNAYGMKDFNSSDIVFKKGNTFYGVSLKKKASNESLDPTLINKSIQSIFEDEHMMSLKKDFDEKTNKFYNGLVTEECKKNKKLNCKGRLHGIEWKKYISQIDNKVVNSYLKGNKSLFKSINEIIKKSTNKFANKLINLILKIDLKELQKENFDFALITGIGKLTRNKIEIGKGNIYDIDSVVEKIDRLSTKKFMLIPTKGKIQAFEKNASAAKLFYTLYSGATPLINLEIRYKGKFTSNPQFLATMTDTLKQILKS